MLAEPKLLLRARNTKVTVASRPSGIGSTGGAWTISSCSEDFAVMETRIRSRAGHVIGHRHPDRELIARRDKGRHPRCNDKRPANKRYRFRRAHRLPDTATAITFRFPLK